MQIIYRLWAVLLAGGIAGDAFAQTRISGKVVDAFDNEPVISASISVVNEKNRFFNRFGWKFRTRSKRVTRYSPSELYRLSRTTDRCV